MVLLTPQLNLRQKASVFYHDFFDYPLAEYELDKWILGEAVKIPKQKIIVDHDQQKEFYFLRGRSSLVKKRKKNTEFSNKKFSRAQWAACWLGCLPTVKMVALTGSMAMSNANENSDLDLMVIASKGALWTTRLLSLCLLKILGFPIRRAGEKEQKDKLCLNLWMDEGDLVWGEKNLFVAHEIAQIIPLAIKDEAYERFLWENSWIKDYWPNAVETVKPKRQQVPKSRLFVGIEVLAFWLQYLYMKRKITSEKVGRTRAQFHPSKRANPEF